MDNTDKILVKAIEEINNQLEDDKKLIYKQDELIQAEGSTLDSLAMLTFIGILEDELKTSGVNVDLMDILMSGDKEGVLARISTLEEFLNKQ